MRIKERTNKFTVIFATLGFLSVISRINSLENGLARTPPMGWLSWVRNYYASGVVFKV